MGTLIAQVSEFRWEVFSTSGYQDLVIATEAAMASGSKVYVVDVGGGRLVAVPESVLVGRLGAFQCGKV